MTTACYALISDADLRKSGKAHPSFSEASTVQFRARSPRRPDIRSDRGITAGRGRQRSDKAQHNHDICSVSTLEGQAGPSDGRADGRKSAHSRFNYASVKHTCQHSRQHLSVGDRAEVSCAFRTNVASHLPPLLMTLLLLINDI